LSSDSKAFGHFTWSFFVFHNNPTSGRLMTMKQIIRALVSSVFLLALGHTEVAHAGVVYFNGSDAKGGYYLVPDNMPQDGTKVWVAVHVHGAGGLRGENLGRDLAKLIGPEPVIILVPSFTSGYQAGDGKWAEQLVGHFKEVSAKYKVHDKMFIHGHSGGGQFAHRFAFTAPELVAGVSAHSSGSWSCAGGYGAINPKAKGIPFAISCGEKDTALSTPDAPYSRIAWYHLFAEELQERGFDVDSRTWPDIGHGASFQQFGEQVRACFKKATDAQRKK
jgi:poly(3-hydroxybutyrate) depolymerase